MPWNERQQLKCEVCRSERTRRSCLVLRSTASEASSLPQHKLEAFIDAPFVHPWRNPTNHAQSLRAIHCARGRESRILWTVAYDKRVNSDGHRTGNQESCLTKMDRDTAGMPGLSPLILDLAIGPHRSLDLETDTRECSQMHAVGCADGSYHRKKKHM